MRVAPLAVALAPLALAQDDDSLFQFHNLRDIDGARPTTRPPTPTSPAHTRRQPGADLLLAPPAGAVFDAAQLKGNVTMIINVASF